MLLDQLKRLTDQRAYPFVTEAEALNKFEGFPIVVIPMPALPRAWLVLALRRRSRKAQHDLLFALSLWRIIALTFAPAIRVDDDEADLTAKRASYDRVPGFMIGSFLLHCLAPQVTRIASMKLAKSTSVGTATEATAMHHNQGVIWVL